MTSLMDELRHGNGGLSAKQRRHTKKQIQLAEETKVGDGIRVRLKKFLSEAPVLYELLCVSEDLKSSNKAKNIGVFVKAAKIFLFKGSGNIGFGRAKNEPKNFHRSLLMRTGEDLWVAELVLWDEIEIYLMPYEDEKKGFACQIMEVGDVYKKPESSGVVPRKIDVICEGDLRRQLALGLIEHYSGMFPEDEWRWYLLNRDFVTAKQYFENQLKETKELLKERRSERESSGPVEVDDGEDAEVYRIFGGKRAYENQVRSGEIYQSYEQRRIKDIPYEPE